jgi:hypothetical protein
MGRLVGGKPTLPMALRPMVAMVHTGMQHHLLHATECMSPPATHGISRRTCCAVFCFCCSNKNAMLPEARTCVHGDSVGHEMTKLAVNDRTHRRRCSWCGHPPRWQPGVVFRGDGSSGSHPVGCMEGCHCQGHCCSKHDVGFGQVARTIQHHRRASPNRSAKKARLGAILASLIAPASLTQIAAFCRRSSI